MTNILLSLIDYFPDLLDMNLTASIVILLVICVRQFLKRAPKIFSYALWGVVLLRLLVPISIESPISIVPEPAEISNIAAVNTVLPEIEFETPKDHTDNAWHRENTPPDEPLVQISRTISAEVYLTFVWLIGIAVMLLRSGVSYWKLRRRVRVSIAFQKGIFLADDMDTPFVMGFFRPVIYLPGTLNPSQQEFIIAHERHHIRRGDHIFKALGFLALTVHWFNPLVWVAFILASRDMEMSCDEAVIRKLGQEVRAEYSASLLNLATGHRLFTGTPLAFGEGDPTGRVRNLAKWKKPALWVMALCVVLCVVLAVCLLTDPQASGKEKPGIPETVPIQPAETQPKKEIPETVEPIPSQPTEEDDWGISIVLEQVSRTEAVVNFVYPRVLFGKPLYYDGFFSLDRLENGRWVTVEDFPGYNPSAELHPVEDGETWCHVWQDPFGALPDGHYRLGERFSVNPLDGEKEERLVYTEFLLPEYIPSGPVPLEELPKIYAADQAMLDGCFVQVDGIAVDFFVEDDGTTRNNKELFRQFAAAAQSGVPSFLRIVNWYRDNNGYYTAYDLSFNGSVYTISWLEDGQRNFKQFQYLKHFSGEKERENVDYDAYEHYVLVNDNTVTWPDIWNDLFSSLSGPFIDHMRVYSDYLYYPELVKLPDSLTQAELEFEGETLLTVTDHDSLKNIFLLFDGVQVIGYEPKTHSTGVGLDLILTSQNGETMTLQLDPENDLCRIGEDYIHYGVPDEPNYIRNLWQCLGLSAWPDPVYEKYPNAYPHSFDP